MLYRLLGKRHQSARDAGIGPDRIELAVAFQRLVDERDDVLLRPGIGLYGLRRAAGLSYLRDGVGDALGTIDRDQLRTLLGEQERCGAPDAAAGAGDDDGFAFEAAHAFPSCSPHQRLWRPAEFQTQFETSK